MTTWTLTDVAIEIASLHPAVRGVRMAALAFKAIRRARRVAQVATCDICTPNDPCKDLRDKIEKLRHELDDRAYDLANNPTNPSPQPYYQVGRPPGKYRFDVGGHRVLFLKKQDEMKQLLQELKDNKCGPPPSGAERTSTMDYPGKMSGPSGPLP